MDELERKYRALVEQISGYQMSEAAKSSSASRSGAASAATSRSGAIDSIEEPWVIATILAHLERTAPDRPGERSRHQGRTGSVRRAWQKARLYLYRSVRTELDGDAQ